jgi:hypothetical protein
MKLVEIPFAVLRFQYQIARFPLQMIEGQVAARMDDEQPARLLYERSLGTLDAKVGSLLGDSDLQKRGNAMVERSNALGRATQLDAAAGEKRQQADETLEATRDDVVTDLKEARSATEQQVVEARSTAEKRKRIAEESAEKRAAAAKKQADNAAAEKVDSLETARRQDEARIQESEKRAARAVDAKLSDARAKRKEATDKLGQADRVEELADIEKQKRKSERASKS